MATTASANTSKRQTTGTAGRRRPDQQIELFGEERPGALVHTPTWQDLPAATQTVLTRLMARLIDGWQTLAELPTVAGPLDLAA